MTDTVPDHNEPVGTLAACHDDATRRRLRSSMSDGVTGQEGAEELRP
ncbi:hypothetical protein ACFPM0_01675 [Pseudonocardia sulfidoxydans]